MTPRFCGKTGKHNLPTTIPSDAIPFDSVLESQYGKVNLDFLDVHRLVKDLARKYNENNDIGVISSWLRRSSLNATENHLHSLLSLVSEVRRHSADLQEFKAQLVAQQSVLQYRIMAMVNEARNIVEKQKLDHASYVHTHEMEKQRRLLEIERLKLENAQIALQNEKLAAEVAQEWHKAKLLGLKVLLIQKINSELDFVNINMKQVFVLIEMIKESRTNADILNAEAQWERMKAEARQAEAKADQEHNNTKYSSWKMDQEMKTPNE